MKTILLITTILHTMLLCCFAQKKELSEDLLSKSLEDHIRAQRIYLHSATKEEKKKYFRSQIPTKNEFNMLFNIKGIGGKGKAAYQIFMKELNIAGLVDDKKGEKPANVIIKVLKRDPSWHYGKIASLVLKHSVFRVDVQEESNLKPSLEGTYAFVNNRWVFLSPSPEVLHILAY